MKTMKKAVVAAAVAGALGLVSVAQAAGFSVTQQFVTDRASKVESQAQVLTYTHDVGKYGVTLLSRTARFENGGGLINSLELTAGRALGPVYVFGGVGHDNGAKQFQYGLVGVAHSLPINKELSLYTAVSSRLNWETHAPEQHLARVGLSLAMSKHASLNAGFMHSSGDIKERGVTVGAAFRF